MWCYDFDCGLMFHNFCMCASGFSRLWLYNIAHGIDHEPVTVRLIPKSIGCSKNFPGKTALGTKKNVEHWMRELTSELVVRLTEDQENVYILFF